MSLVSVEQYLKNIVNRKENLEELLLQYIETTKSNAGAIFIRDYENFYFCLEHTVLDSDTKYNNPNITSSQVIANITTDINIYTAPYEIKTLLGIPISSNTEIIGLVCVINRSGEYNDELIEELIENLSGFIGITQLIINKEKIIHDYKDKVQDTSLSKDLFLANMSHEIRTPANGVIGYGQLLMQTELNSTQKGYLTSQNQCSIQLMQIINDILDFSKLSSGKMNIVTECFSLPEIFETVRGMIKSRIEEKKQKIRFTMGEDLPEFVILDKQKIIQVLLNLISNANKFTDIGGFIDVSFRKLETNILQIVVKDNGMGISEEDQKKLFNTFEQLQSNLYKTGTGLGLVICQKIARLLGGDISVKSTLGLGSSFVVTVKYKPFEDYKKDMEKDVKLLKNKLILVVDDNTDNRILLSEMLFEWEMKPIVCASPLEALRMIMGNRYKFSLGLIDICMPNISGTDLAKQIKEEKPFFPLIALSSLDTFVRTQEFVQKLDKPINKVQLFNAIYRVLSNTGEQVGFIGDDSEVVSPENMLPSDVFNYDLRILIAEDIVYNRTLLENMMTVLGYTNIQSAENGKIAINMIVKAQEENDPYQILLLDLRMPVMDGYDVIQYLKNNNLNIPRVVVITASVVEEDRSKCKKMGICYFLTKPIELHQLKEVMLHKQKNLIYNQKN